MNHDDTYRMEELPPEAVMTPATEELPGAPPLAARLAVPDPEPVAAPDPEPDPRAMIPASIRQTASSRRFESLRSRMRDINLSGAEWIDAAQRPIDRPTAVPPAPPAPPPNATGGPIPQTRPLTGGNALQTLMRSAVRQHAPAPALTGQHTSVHRAVPQQMRGALQQVVRDRIWK